MIASIWPSFGQSPSLTKQLAMGATVNYMVGFILFWLGSLPFIWFPVHKIRHLFSESILNMTWRPVLPYSHNHLLTCLKAVKAIVSPIGGVALLIWCVVRAGGVGPIVRQPATATGSELAWAVIGGIMASISNFATLIVNDPDFAR